MLKKLTVFVIAATLAATYAGEMHKAPNEDMRWATGGVCNAAADCASTGENFCSQHGGVAILQYDRSKADDWSCTIRCGDDTIGHAGCVELVEADTDGGGKGDDLIWDQCDDGFIGPQNPDVICPCNWPEICT